MKKLVTAVLFCIALVCPLLAQSGDDTPATKADIEKYLEATHVRDLLNQMMDSMAEQMHQMTTQQCAQNKDKLPPDCEATLNKMMDSMLKEMPFNEMLDAMIPVYQKHLTKGDVDHVVAFYNSPTGQKITRVSPQIMSESMTAIMPIIQRYSQQMQDRMQKEIEDSMRNSQGASAPDAGKK